MVGGKGTPNYYLWGSRGGIMAKFREGAMAFSWDGKRDAAEHTRVFSHVVVRDNSLCFAMTLADELDYRTVTRETR